MNRFDYVRASSAADAVAQISSHGQGPDRHAPSFLAGGTNLVDLWREGVAQPARVVDISRLDLNRITVGEDGAALLGALATNAVTANHPAVVKGWPLVRSAILAGASPQIRNRATNGGNLLQRTRCLYFYDIAVPCNKREPGSGCPAVTGIARQHAILGASDTCIATHPSDLCVALAALDATVHVTGPDGDRVIAFESFHRLPSDRPDVDTTLQPGELITHIRVPANELQAHSCYLKLRERASYAFALVSVAAALRFDDQGRIADARVALGGVAHKPWRDRDAEQLLVGAEPAAPAFKAFAARLLREARAWGADVVPGTPPGNSFKIPLAARAIVRALEMARDGVPTNTGEDAFRALGADERSEPAGEVA